MKNITHFRTTFFFLLLSTIFAVNAMQRCPNGDHDIFRYVEILPHSKCDDKTHCGFCCDGAIRRIVEQCQRCGFYMCEHFTQIPPAEIFKKPTTDEADLLGASIAGDVGKVEELLAKQVNPNARTSMRAGASTPLILAASAGRIEVMRRLLSAGADANKMALNGETALLDAAFISGTMRISAGVLLAKDTVDREKNEEMVRILLAAGARPDLHGFDFTTPLILALSARKEGHTIARALFEAGASPFHKALSSPIDYADEEMKPVVQEYQDKWRARL